MDGNEGINQIYDVVPYNKEKPEEEGSYFVIWSNGIKQVMDWTYKHYKTGCWDCNYDNINYIEFWLKEIKL